MEIGIRQVSTEDPDAVTNVEARCFPETEAATKASFGQPEATASYKYCSFPFAFSSSTISFTS